MNEIPMTRILVDFPPAVSFSASCRQLTERDSTTLFRAILLILCLCVGGVVFEADGPEDDGEE